MGDWVTLNEAVTMRNKLVHGERAYALADCSAKAKHIVTILRALRSVADGAPWHRSLETASGPQKIGARLDATGKGGLTASKLSGLED
jgi:hypothetical protein